MRALEVSLAFLDRQPDGRRHRRLNRRAADLAVALRRVPIAAGEQGALDFHRQIQDGARRDVLAVYVPAGLVGGDCREVARNGTRDADGAQEGAHGNPDARLKHSVVLLGSGTQIPDLERRLRELVGQEAEPGEDGCPAVGCGFEIEKFNFEDITGFGAVDGYGAKKGVNEGEVEFGHVGQDGFGGELVVTTVKEVVGYCSAGVDCQDGLLRVVPF